MTSANDKPVGDGLAEVMGLLGKATPGPWRECGHDRGGCVCGLIFSEPADAAVAITAIHDDELPKPMPGVPQANMQAIAAAVNYLRSHGEAIRELVRCASRHEGHDPQLRDALAQLSDTGRKPE